MDPHFALNTGQLHTQVGHFSKVSGISGDSLLHLVSAAVQA